MKAAVKMPQKCFEPFRILGPSESFCDAPDAQKLWILKVKSLTSLHDTSGTIQSCPLQLHSPAFLSLRRGLTRNFSLDYTPGWTDTLRYAQEVIRGIVVFSTLLSFWNIPYSDLSGSTFFSPAHSSLPLITLVFLSVSPQGVFYPLENLTDPPFSSVPFVLPEHSDSMIYIGISEYFFKSASYAYFTAGAFNVTLTTEKVRRVNGWWQSTPTFNLVISIPLWGVLCHSFYSWAFVDTITPSRTMNEGIVEWVLILVGELLGFQFC